MAGWGKERLARWTERWRDGWMDGRRGGMAGEWEFAMSQIACCFGQATLTAAVSVRDCQRVSVTLASGGASTQTALN